MTKVQLHGYCRNDYTIIDNEDYEIVNLFNWRQSKARYIYTTITLQEKLTTLYLHRLILNAPKGLQVDHKNHNKADNRKTNLRLCSNAENHMNRQIYKNNSSVYKGVKKVNNKWRSTIKKNGKSIHIGYFHEETAAAQAYDVMARHLFGEFACYNNIL